MGEAVVESGLTVKVGGTTVPGIPVSLGNPHYVVFVKEFSEGWQHRAAEIQRSSLFPQGVNVEFVTVDGGHEISARFYERGAGETQSSGTGSCASAVAAMATGRAESPVRVEAPGGVLAGIMSSTPLDISCGSLHPLVVVDSVRAHDLLVRSKYYGRRHTFHKDQADERSCGCAVAGNSR